MLQFKYGGQGSLVKKIFEQRYEGKEKKGSGEELKETCINEHELGIALCRSLGYILYHLIFKTKKQLLLFSFLQRSKMKFRDVK